MHSRRHALPAILSMALAAFAGCSKAPAPLGSSPPMLDPSIAIATVPLERMEDPQLRYLVEASSIWRKSRGPIRAVVDQVVLVSDVDGFLAALGTWNETSYFPILIDDPAWTPAFVRAFRPARIVRFSSLSEPARSGPLDEWLAAERAVGRSWMRGDEKTADPPPAGSPLRRLGPTPPGVVLSHPTSPSLAGAAALAAGRFQPLLRVEPLEMETANGKPAKILGFDDVPSVAQALDFARRVESRVAAIAPEYDGLGDSVDFLTLAGVWPYRYRAAGGLGVPDDDRALDDLVGRVLPSGSVDVDSLRLRWAYTGRLLGDASASVYRAMASLFLQPRSALLWNTYSGGPPWSEYDVSGARSMLGLIRPAPDAVVARSGAAADLTSWHEATSIANTRDLILLNTSGAPDEFSITGGPGLSADVPFGPPAVVSLIHSFSAAAPNDPTTIAGRFLLHGTFAYFGSLNEPYLTAFRSPYLVTQMMAVETPISAALRQGPYESFGKPWRLVYLGDPLYRIEPSTVSGSLERTRPDDAADGASPLTPRDRPDLRDPGATLDWCYDAVLLAMTHPASEARSASIQASEVLGILSVLDREQLDPTRRARFDALLIDQSAAIGDVAGLLRRLLEVPAGSRSPVVWRAIETAVLDRLADFLRRDDFTGALDLWHPIAIGAWPPGSDFPARLTRRLALAAGPEASVRIEPFRRRLIEARNQLDGSIPLAERRAMLAEELRRMGKSTPTP